MIDYIKRKDKDVGYLCPSIVEKASALKKHNSLKVRLDSLKVRFGLPYLFIHQGDCEHLIVFRDIRYVLLSRAAVVFGSTKNTQPPRVCK